MVNKAYGVLLIIVAIALTILYLMGLVIVPDMPISGSTFSELLTRYTILVFMIALSGVIGYIGYLIVTSPIPKPVEEIIKEYREQTK